MRDQRTNCKESAASHLIHRPFHVVPAQIRAKRPIVDPAKTEPAARTATDRRNLRCLGPILHARFHDRGHFDYLRAVTWLQRSEVVGKNRTNRTHGAPSPNTPPLDQIR